MHRIILNIYMLPLFISALLSLKSIRLKWPAPYRTFSILLIAIFIVETVAISWKYWFFDFPNWPYSRSNLWLYNSFLIPQYLLYMAVYYQMIRSVKIKRTILVLGVAYALFAFINQSLIQHVHAVNSYTLLAASCIVLFLTISYTEQLRGELEITRVRSEPMVLISLGAAIYHAASIPYMLALNWLITHDKSLANTLLYVYIGLNCIMYSLFIIAFLCNPTNRK